MRKSIIGTVCVAAGCGGQAVQASGPGVAARTAGVQVKAAEHRAVGAGPGVPIVPADPDEHAIAELRRARGLFTTFIEKAGAEPAYADAVKRSRDRIADLDATIAFLEQGLGERRGGR